MKQKTKPAAGATVITKSKDNSFYDVLTDSNYFHFIIPSLYFIVMFFVAMFNRPIGGTALETDFYWSYAPAAKEFLKGNLIIDIYRGPLYQIVLAGFGYLFGNDIYSAGKFLNVLSAAVTLIFVSKIIGSIFSRNAALLTVLFVAVNTLFIQCTYEPGTDMLFLVFYTSSIYFILKNKIFNSKDFLISGVLCGLAYLTRYTAISLIFSLFVMFLISIYKNFKYKESNNGQSGLKPFIYFSLPVITIISLWGLYCLKYAGEFFYNRNYLNTAYTVYKTDKIMPDDWTLNYQNSFTSFYDVVFRDFGTFFYKIFIVNFSTFFLRDLNNTLMLIPAGVFVVSGLVLFLINFKKNNLQQRYFFLFSFVFYLQILFAFYSERFSLPLLPFYSFLIVKTGDYDFLKKFNKSLGKIKLFTLIAFLLISLNFIYSYNFVNENINKVPVEILSLSKWLKENQKEDFRGKTIMARKPHIAYYMDTKFEVIPFSENYEQLQEKLKTSNADYLYIGGWESSILAQPLRKALLDFKNVPEGLELVSYIPFPLAILYKIKK